MNTSTFRQITKIILTAYLLEFHKIKKKNSNCIPCHSSPNQKNNCLGIF